MPVKGVFLDRKGWLPGEEEWSAGDALPAHAIDSMRVSESAQAFRLLGEIALVKRYTLVSANDTPSCAEEENLGGAGCKLLPLLIAWRRSADGETDRQIARWSFGFGLRRVLSFGLAGALRVVIMPCGALWLGQTMEEKWQ